jgi:hypothetical protein
MDRRRNGGFGLTAVTAALAGAAIAYWIANAEAPSLPFAIAQYVLLGCAVIAGLDAFAHCRPAR